MKVRTGIRSALSRLIMFQYSLGGSSDGLEVLRFRGPPSISSVSFYLNISAINMADITGFRRLTRLGMVEPGLLWSIADISRA